LGNIFNTGCGDSPLGWSGKLAIRKYVKDILGFTWGIFLIHIVGTTHWGGVLKL
jgi:hypothetical protein